MNKLPAWMRLTFKGRVNRFRYFWYPIGLGLILGIPSFILMAIYGFEAVNKGRLPMIPYLIDFTMGTIIQLYTISFSVRRLHDLNRSGWLILPIAIPLLFFSFFPILLIPLFIFTGYFVIGLFGFALLAFEIYLLFFKGTVGPNKYGPDPLDYPEYEDYLKVLENNSSENSDTRFDRE